MSSRIIQGDVFDVLPTLKPGSVDCVVTSPPYWMLRSYLPKGHALKPRELGSEKTPAEFVANMVRVFGLVRETMADHATCWLNMGDSYSGTGKSGGGVQGEQWDDAGAQVVGPRGGKYLAAPSGIDAGNLCLIPQRLAIALQDDGWYVRSVVVWHKPAPMPASLSGWRWVRCRVKTKGQGKSGLKLDSAGLGNSPPFPGDGIYRDAAQWSDCPGCPKCKSNDGYVLRRGSWRPTSSWEPILMLAKSAKYYADGDAVKTPAKSATVSRDQYTRILDDPDEQFAVQHDHETVSDGGANLRDVWTIAAEPLKEKHYAAFPTELVRLCLKAGTSEKGYCRECGKPWARVVEQIDTGRVQKMADGWDTGPGAHGSIHRNGREKGEPGQPVMESKTIGWRPVCSCPANEPRPALVLDPFAGSGRTGVTAQRMFLDFVGCELNPDYHAMATKILKADCPLFAS